MFANLITPACARRANTVPARERAAGWVHGLALLLAFALLALAWFTSGAAHARGKPAGGEVLFGPQSAQISPVRGRPEFFGDIHLYSRSRHQHGPYRLVIDNSSAALTPKHGVKIEIWNNLRLVARETDLFDKQGRPVPRLERPLDVRPFFNLIIVKVRGRAPVSFSYRVVAGQDTSDEPTVLRAMAPGTLPLTNGASGLFHLTLQPASPVAGQIQLSSSAPGVASVPAQVPFAAGQTSVAVPVQALGVGSSTVRASLNGSSVSATAQVNPAPPRVAALLPAQAQLQEGATGAFSVSITPAQLQPVTVTLSSTQPSRIQVPASVVVPAGQTVASFEAQALEVGSAQLMAVVQGMPSGAAYSQVQVVPQPPTVVALLPATNVLQQGSTATLTVSLSAAQSTPVDIPLSVEQPAVAGVPAQVTVPAGAQQASFSLQALAVGQTLVAATLNGSRVEAAVQVNPVPAAIASLLPAQASVTVGAQADLVLRLNAAQPTDTTITLATAPSGVVQVPGQLIIPAGQTQATVQATALAVGQADVVASLGGVSRSSTLTVVPVPVAIESLLPNPLGLQQGASGNLVVRLNATQPQAVDVAVSTAQPTLLQVPATLTVPAGQLEAALTVQGLAVGEATVVASANGSSAQTVVRIAAPPPAIASLMPVTQDLPKGKVGTLRLTLDRAPVAPASVALSNSNSTVLGLPATITVAAGQLTVDVPLTAITQGSATVGASLNGSSAQATVQVVDPEVTGVQISPASVNLSAGQSAELQATATYSDGSQRNVSTGAGTAWSVLDSAVASVSAEGRVIGLGTGSTTVQALQAVLPTHGNPNPPPVVGQAEVVVSAGSPLALSTSRTSLLTGESVVVSITSPYAASANPITVTLQTSGTGGLQVPASASIGPGLTSVNVTVQASRAGPVVLSATASQYAPGELSFSVSDPVVSGVSVSGVEPASAAPGASVTLSGAGFASPADSNTVAFFGGAPAEVVSGSATQLIVKVPVQAQSGPISVTNAQGSAQSPDFTVLREQDFGFSASPAQLQLMQGSSAAASLQLNSSGTQPFEGLAKLSVSGLPAGVTAEFDPPQLSAVQTGRLLLKATNDTPLSTGAVTLSLRAEARLNGLPWVRQSQISVQVISRANVTAVKGRFVTPEGRPVPGVIVRQDTSTNQVTSDAAGNFFLQGLPAGETTLRFDATPANPLYPIWPMNVTLQAGELRTYEEWVINPPPGDEKFILISNATQEQRIADTRYPGFEVVLPAGASITGWDGVKKTRIAVERLHPDKLPVEQPPFAMKEAYQLYFGTPMGGIPSQPIPVTLPNVAERDPGEEVEIWWFDGSPMGGSGEWKMAGMGTVSDDGKTVSSNPGVGLPRFCGVCGVVCLNSDPPPLPPEPPPVCPPPQRGNPIDLYTGQEMPRTQGMSCGGRVPVDLGWRYNPVDSFQNKAYTRGSFGLGWFNAYDLVFVPFAGGQKRMVMPGGARVNFTGANSAGDYTTSHPLFQGVVARQIASDTGNAGDSISASTLSFSMSSRSSSSVSSGSGGGGSGAAISLDSRFSVSGGSTWEVLFKDGTRWIFEPYTGLATVLPGNRERGGPPSWLTRVIDRNGNAVKISRSASGKITRIEGAGGRRFELGINADDHVSSIVDHTGRQTAFEYTENHRIASVTDPEGRKTRYKYRQLPVYSGPAGISAGSKPSTGSTVSSGSTDSGGGGGSSSVTISSPIACGDFIPWLHEKKSSSGGTISIQPPPRKYPVYEGLEEIHYPWSSQPTVNTYSTDRVLRQTTSTGEVRHFSYRRTGACVAKVIPGSEARTPEEFALFGDTGVTQQTEFTCRAGKPYVHSRCSGPSCEVVSTGMCPEMESEESHAQGWRFYGGSNSETTVIEPNGQKIAYRFGARGLPLEYTDESGQSTQYEYDAQGQLASVSDPLGRVTRLQHDSWGNLLSKSGPLGRRVDHVYHPDHLQRTQTTQYLSGASSSQGGQNLSYTPLVSSFAYDERGNMRSVRTPLGKVTQFEYDSDGQLLSQTHAITTGVNSLPIVSDGTVSSIAASARKTQFEYTPAGDLAAVTNALGERVAMQSDALGRIIEVADPLSFTSTQAYNANGQPTKSTDALGQQSRLEYDSAGRLSAVVNAAGVTIERYGYDGLGRLVRVTDASNRDTTLEYDSANRLAAFTDRKGQRFTLDHDERGLVTRLSGPDRSIDARYDSVGRLAELQDASSTVAYRYDEADRVIEERTTTAAGQWSLGYQYDSLDRVAQRTLSGSALAAPEVTAYQWDHASRLIEQTTRFGPEGAQSEHQTRYRYDDAARLQSRSSQITANGAAEPTITQRYHYDEVDRLSRIEYVQNAGQATEQQLERIDYQYDARGQRTGKTTLNNHGAGSSDTPMEASYDSANRLQSITLKPSADAATHKTYQLSYDANGNLTQKVYAADGNEKTVYTWDAQDKLIALQKTENGQTITASYQYDLFGRRIGSSIQVGTASAQNPAQTVQYLYEGQQALGEVRNQTLSHRLITGLGLDETIARIAIVGTGAADVQASRQLLTDALNSVIAQANAQGTGIANSQGYSPYGESSTIGPDATNNTAQYTSRENDAQGASGLYFYRARYYDPMLKRFISSDPIGLAGGINTYAYVGGAPTMFTDPLGLKHKAGSDHCKAIKRKIDNLNDDLDDRWNDLKKGGLPERLLPKGQGELPSKTMRGHRMLINERDSNLRKWEKRYDDECEPDDKDDEGGCDECTAGAVAATMVGGYLVYRCVRMLPSLLPPLWWTIPVNAAAP